MSRFLDGKRSVLVVVFCLALVIAACNGSDSEDVAGPNATTTPDTPYAGYASSVYADLASWLCHPDTIDPCDEDLNATIVHADGSVEADDFEPAADAPIDCFYVYPTVSVDPGTNSDLVPDPEFEGFVVRNQAARFASQCRLFAPVYRQFTLTALIGALGAEEGADAEATPGPDPREIAYESMLDAWKHYIANDNDGRGVVLIGHSQGSSLLRRLIQDEIDNDEQLRGRLVSAILLGTTVAVPQGADVGGSFANIPLCRHPAQTGCVISYASFLETVPPAEDANFGRASEGMAACTNPASLAGGRGPLRPYFESERAASGFNERAFVRVVEEPWAVGVDITTPWVTLPDFIEAECVVRGDASYLEITVLADPSDPRTDDLGGDIILTSWGLHVVDANLAMGDLVDIVAQQAQTHITAGR